MKPHNFIHDLGDIEVTSHKISGRATVVLDSVQEINKRELNDLKSQEVTSIIGKGKIEIHETKFAGSSIDKYHKYPAYLVKSYDVALIGEATSTLSINSKEFTKKGQPITEIVETTHKFGEKDLKLVPKMKNHHIFTHYYGIENRPIYEKTETIQSQNPNEWQKVTYQYHQIIENCEWDETFNSIDAVDAVKATDLSKFKIMSLKRLNEAIDLNDFKKEEAKIGIKIIEKISNNLKPKGYLNLGFTQTETIEQIELKIFYEKEKSALLSLYKTLENAKTEMHKKLEIYKNPMKKLTIESHEGIKGLFLNKTTLVFKQKTFSKTKTCIKLNQASLSSISILSSGITSLILYRGKKVSITDFGKIALHTVKNFFTNYALKIAETQKSFKIAGCIIATTSVVTMLTSIGLTVFNENDERTKYEKFVSGLKTGIIDLVLSALQVGLTMTKYNYLTYPANGVIIACFSSKFEFLIAFAAPNFASKILLDLTKRDLPVETNGYTELFLSVTPYIASGIFGAFASYFVQKLLTPNERYYDRFT